MLDELQQLINQVKVYYTVTLWRETPANTSLLTRVIHAPLKLLILTFQKFKRDNSMLHASALTYVSLLAIIPVLVLALTSLRAFGVHELAREKIITTIQENVEMQIGTEAFHAPLKEASATPTAQDDTIELEDKPSISSQDAHYHKASISKKISEVTHKVFEQIDKINFARMGGVGAVSLIFTVLLVLGHIEASFNHIWLVKKNRSIIRKFTDYLSVLIVAPMLLVASSTISVIDKINTINSQAGGAVATIADWRIVSMLSSLVALTLLFTFLFSFFPNRHVNLKSGFIGGFFTALAMSITFKLFSMLQVGIGSSSILYGSLAAFPIVLFWLHSTWQILLIGSELTFVHQHYESLAREHAFSTPSLRNKIELGLALCLEAANAVASDKMALVRTDFINRVHIPDELLTHLGEVLFKHKILMPIHDDLGTVTGYMLCQCASRLTVAAVIKALLDDQPGEPGITAKFADYPVMAQLDTQLNQSFDALYTMTLLDVVSKQAHA